MGVTFKKALFYSKMNFQKFKPTEKCPLIFSFENNKIGSFPRKLIVACGSNCSLSEI